MKFKLNNHYITSVNDVKEAKSYSLKDIYLTKNIKTTAASKVLKDFIPKESSDVYNILRNAGYNLRYKGNLDEFACGDKTNCSFFGSCLLDGMSPGGSSGGCAASVKADLVDFGIGSDTGGSVRYPACLLQIIGFKPSLGRISRKHMISYSDTLDVVSILTKDINILIEVFNTLKDKGEDLLLTHRIPKPNKSFINMVDYLLIDKRKLKRIYMVIAYSELYSNLSRYFSNRKWSTYAIQDKINYKDRDLYLRNNLKHICRYRYFLGRRFIRKGWYAKWTIAIDVWRKKFDLNGFISCEITKEWDDFKQEVYYYIANLLNLPAIIFTHNERTYHCMGPRYEEETFLKKIKDEFYNRH